ncbi:sensor histidine kinase [Spirosoma rhododendri]|uniref:histidine kinase n=1 Tax=Spirosoma rhododendri TaxID=2728024 RepID=A0A7L5DQK1_9BACT|nr:PAS domain-containing sensor histidine kinase [Spirosoma rhododendri]QJD79872.1 PAS domain S-box protein [Spirosoma rhododendri]
MSTNSATPVLTALLAEPGDDFIGLFDPGAGQFTRVNAAGALMLGFATEADLLTQLNQANPSAGLVSAVMQIARPGLTQLPQGTEVELVHRDGTQFHARLTVTNIPENNHDIWLVRLRNLGRLYQAERALQQSLLRYEAVFTNATIGIIVANQAGQIVSANQLARHLFGYPDNELVGLSIDQLVPTNVGRCHKELRQSFNANPQVRAMGHNRDLHARRRDGSVFPVEVSLSYFKKDDQLYAVAYIIDITFKKEAESQLLTHRDRIERLNAELEQKVIDRTHALMTTLEQLEQSKDELAKALSAERRLGELKSRFVSMASHEFRTPLTTVLTSATLIEKYPGLDQQDKRQKHIQRIRASVDHLNDILEEFLSVGRLEEGNIDVRPVRVELARLVDEVIGDMQALRKPDQVIQTEMHGPDWIWLDASLLRKVIVNLLSNAIKYSDAGSVIWVRASWQHGQLQLSVIDQGVGIAPADQAHLFEWFYRAKNAGNVPGTGLGLHIVGRYVDLMGGRVSLHSELNRGTTVSLTLPYEEYPAD